MQESVLHDALGNFLSKILASHLNVRLFTMSLTEVTGCNGHRISIFLWKHQLVNYKMNPLNQQTVVEKVLKWFFDETTLLVVLKSLKLRNYIVLFCLLVCLFVSVLWFGPFLEFKWVKVLKCFKWLFIYIKKSIIHITL